MLIQKAALDSILLNNVCEIRFARRIIKPGQAATRRMICTKSLSLLNSVNYRNINMNQCDLIQEIPANDDFWVYFNENIYPMSTEQKANFMNS